ncbi:HTH-type transcriptional regulator LysM [Candidatus Gugararchaeum adminiculabundum]|nr:HTH-type transcriptional regulator LysM [Candidatus Gugararchaeum adminiculabundum]
MAMESGLNVFIGAVTEEKTPTAQIAKKLLAIPGIESVYELTGELDILIQVKSPSVSKINEILEAIRATEGIEKTTTYLVLDKHVKN